jgi:hypothetical protein
MNRKPKIIGAIVLVLICCSLFFVKNRIVAKPQGKEISEFLSELEYACNGSSVDSLAVYFDGAKSKPELYNLLGVLINKNSIGRDSKPLFKTTLLFQQSEVANINTELTKITIPVLFDDGISSEQTASLVFLVRKNQAGHLRVVKVENNNFTKGYLAYQQNVKYRKHIDDTHYDVTTLKAFADANKLKSKYDSVVWFAHVNDQVYFYVVNGKWEDGEDGLPFNADSTNTVKMGLVNPNFKEIIPAKYDLVYTINGSIKGLVEVEKNKRRGFYDLSGKNILPVIYDQIFPLADDENLAVLQRGDDYFYLKKDTTVSLKTDIKVSDFFSKIKNIRSSYAVNANYVPAIIEYNARGANNAIYLAPSYLVDLDLVNGIQYYKNPFRTDSYEERERFEYQVSSPGKQAQKSDNVFEAFFYSIKNYFVGGREGFYDKKNIVFVDKKHDKIYSNSITSVDGADVGGLIDGICDVNSMKMIDDTLIEVKVGGLMYFNLYNGPDCIIGGPIYQYLVIRNNKLVQLSGGGRDFAFTKYVKMDDSYLQSCYLIADTARKVSHKNTKERSIDHVNSEMLRYMKNEIYGNYNYKFKDPRWNMLIYEKNEMGGMYEPKNVNVNDSLTVIDKYNIAFIDRKLKGIPGQKAPVAKVLAAK